MKLVAGFHYSRIMRRPFQFGLPVFVSVEPTTSCNLRCPQCPSGLREFTRPTGMLSSGLFEKIILQLKHELHSLTFYFQGEPYLHPEFLNMVKFANRHRIYTSTSTNAHYLSEENAKQTVLSKLDKLIISVDGLTQEVYEQYRVGGTLAKVIEGTKEVLKQRQLLNSRTPHVIWQFVVFKPNQSQIEGIKKLGKELGVDEVKIKTAQIYDFETSDELIPDREEFSRYRKNEAGGYELINKLQNQCWRMWQGCVITWDGKIVPCCFDKDAHHQLGSLETNPFKEIWFSERYNNFRKSVLTGRKNIEICKNCSEGTKVWS
ncbi:MAG: radical SAM/SPASM domain-containing protein [bacterium]|nr:radical SAM/SPASM domain-containing protein [bacterium]